MVEGFNGRIAEVIRQTCFKLGAEPEVTITAYIHAYNHRIPQRALGQQLPSWHCRYGN